MGGAGQSVPADEAGADGLFQPGAGIRFCMLQIIAYEVGAYRPDEFFLRPGIDTESQLHRCRDKIITVPAEHVFRQPCKTDVQVGFKYHNNFFCSNIHILSNSSLFSAKINRIAQQGLHRGKAGRIAAVKLQPEEQRIRIITLQHQLYRALRRIQDFCILLCNQADFIPGLQAGKRRETSEPRTAKSPKEAAFPSVPSACRSAIGPEGR